MSECHVVHIGRDSRLQAVTVEVTIQKGVPSGEIKLWWSRFIQKINDVTEAHLTPAQAIALAERLLDAASDVRGEPKRYIVTAEEYAQFKKAVEQVTRVNAYEGFDADKGHEHRPAVVELDEQLPDASGAFKKLDEPVRRSTGRFA